VHQVIKYAERLLILRDPETLAIAIAGEIFKALSLSIDARLEAVNCPRRTATPGLYSQQIAASAELISRSLKRANVLETSCSIKLAA
jgi:hypothetical protein